MNVVEALEEEATWKEVPCPTSVDLAQGSVALSRFNLSADGSKVTFMSRPTMLRRVLLEKLLDNHHRYHLS